MEPLSKQITNAEIQNTDVLVIGSGLAGMGAAIEAVKHNAKVILLEKLDHPGGTSALSAGSFYAADTAIQQKHQITDNSEQFFDDWMKLATQANDEYVDAELVRYITEHSAENLEWLIEHGVHITDKIKPSGKYEGRTTPRIHYAKSGKEMMSSIFDALSALNIPVYFNTRVTTLIQNNQSIIGVKAIHTSGEEIQIHASSVIIASGGFSGNPEMMAQYYPQYKRYENASVNVGDSIKMAEAVQADIIVKNAAQIFHTLPTDFGIGFSAPEGVYITPDGQRYVDENEYFFTRTRKLNDTGFGDTHLLVPAPLYARHSKGIDQAIAEGMAFRTDTIEALAIHLDVQPNVLQSTIEQYNAYARAGYDSDFHKPSEYLYPLEAPYIGLMMTGFINDTFTSIRINKHAQVIDQSGHVMKGLYAAGGAASSQTLNQEYIGSGASLLNGLTFGRVAGRHAATNIIQSSI